ncbi:hypothetical protein [Micrococcus sp. HOU01]|uniref:hypothetical protein n=1 Tax=Micrococcus sp. HOU01 TaxID=3101753 RepID=UPI002D782AA0|nr:hypothetical protein [Micrococcus sp. HOU1]WRQ42639.1 hypothetical protein SOY78_06250 [Micrococcus sp. HOU1]
MEYESAGELDGVPIGVPTDEGYRTCSACGGDCEPDTSLSSDGTGVRIAWVCPEHGAQSVVDPFSDLR